MFKAPTLSKADVTAYSVPTDAPEADGTFSWNATTIVLVELSAGNESGIGYTYGNRAIAKVAEHLFAKCLTSRSPLDIAALNLAMIGALRNSGSRGMAAMAVSMLDLALWDLKARLLGCSVSQLMGKVHDRVPIYGSGGFTSYSDSRLTQQLTDWVNAGIHMVKMKVGSDATADPRRVRIARKAIGDAPDLMVDANGAYSVKQALALADFFSQQRVRWFEEPVSSDRLEDLALIRRRTPAGMEIAAGEYGYDPYYFRRMLEAGAVDVLQADATRCCGFSGFLGAAHIAGSFGIPISAHCAPSLHMHVGCAVPGFRNIEYFHDHVRIERMLFDGFIEQKNGYLQPDVSRPGLGLTFKKQDALKFAA